MNKSDAESIAFSGITKEQVKAMLTRALLAGYVDGTQSSVNQSMTKADSFAIFLGGYEGSYKDGKDKEPITGIDCIVAMNALREFGAFWFE